MRFNPSASLVSMTLALSLAGACAAADLDHDPVAGRSDAVTGVIVRRPPPAPPPPVTRPPVAVPPVFTPTPPPPVTRPPVSVPPVTTPTPPPPVTRPPVSVPPVTTPVVTGPPVPPTHFLQKEQPVRALAGFSDGAGLVPEHELVVTKGYVQWLDYDFNQRTNSAHTDAYESLAGFVAASAHRTADGYRHVITVEESGDVYELWSSPSGQGNAARLTNIPGIVGVASYDAADDGYQHVILALGDGSLREIYYNPGYGVFQSVLGNPTGPAQIRAVAAHWDPNFRRQEIFVANDAGEILGADLPPLGQRSGPLTFHKIGAGTTQTLAFASPIVAISSFAYNTMEDVVVATADGTVTNVVTGPGAQGFWGKKTLTHVDHPVAVSAYAYGYGFRAHVIDAAGDIFQVVRFGDGETVPDQVLHLAGVDTHLFAAIDDRCLPGGDQWADIAWQGSIPTTENPVTLEWKVVRGGPAGWGQVTLDGQALAQYFEGYGQLPAQPNTFAKLLVRSPETPTLSVTGPCGTRLVTWSFTGWGPPPPAAPSVTLDRTYINQGETTKLRWTANLPSTCGAASATVTAQKWTAFDWDRQIFSVQSGLPASGSMDVSADQGTEYVVSVTCQNGGASKPASTQLSVYVPAAPPADSDYYCYEVTYPASRICSTFAYLAASEADAPARAHAESPTGQVSSIDCDDLSSSCPPL
jgi:hypothetical protein